MGVRLGGSGNLSYVWCENGEEVSKRIEIKLNSGDIYIMSEKSVGNDWLSRKKLTLRHGMETVKGKILKKITKKVKKKNVDRDLINLLSEISQNDRSVSDGVLKVIKFCTDNNISKEEIIKSIEKSLEE